MSKPNIKRKRKPPMVYTIVNQNREGKILKLDNSGSVSGIRDIAEAELDFEFTNKQYTQLNSALRNEGVWEFSCLNAKIKVFRRTMYRRPSKTVKA